MFLGDSPTQGRRYQPLAARFPLGLGGGAPTLVSALDPPLLTDTCDRALMPFALLAFGLVELPLPRELPGEPLFGPPPLALALTRSLSRGTPELGCFRLLLVAAAALLLALLAARHPRNHQTQGRSADEPPLCARLLHPNREA